MNLQEQINRIQSMMGVLTEETDNKTIKIFKNGKGSKNSENYKGEVVNISLKDVLPNEVAKTDSYMKTNQTANDLIKSIKNKEEIEPIKVLKHPYDSSKYIVIDGHHRRYAYNKSGVDEVPAVIISPKDVVLINKDDNMKLDKVHKDKDVVDMYFTKPDGTNSF